MGSLWLLFLILLAHKLVMESGTTQMALSQTQPLHRRHPPKWPGASGDGNFPGGEVGSDWCRKNGSLPDKEEIKNLHKQQRMYKGMAIECMQEGKTGGFPNGKEICTTEKVLNWE